MDRKVTILCIGRMHDTSDVVRRMRDTSDVARRMRDMSDVARRMRDMSDVSRRMRDMTDVARRMWDMSDVARRITLEHGHKRAVVFTLCVLPNKTCRQAPLCVIPDITASCAQGHPPAAVDRPF